MEKLNNSQSKLFDLEDENKILKDKKDVLFNEIQNLQSKFQKKSDDEAKSIYT